MRPPVLGLCLFVLGCPGGEDDTSKTAESAWQVVATDLPAGLMSVQGTSADDVWMVGAAGTVYHYDGAAVSAVDVGTTEDVWWVAPGTAGPLLVGANGLILDYDVASGQGTPSAGPAEGLFFGVWGPSPDDLWAVGGDTYGAGAPLIWRNSGGTWGSAATVPAGVNAPEMYYKVHGKSASDLWVVGTAGIIQHWDGAGWTDYDCGGDGVLFTVHTGGDVTVAVGGAGQALVCNFDPATDTWTNVSPAFLPTINGVTGRGSTMIGVGQQGTVIRWDGSAWIADEERPTTVVLHGVWVDEEGGIWAVGGNLNSTPITGGVILYQGPRTVNSL